MKTELSIYQSAHLFNLGVPKEKATEFEPFNDQDGGEFIFTLDDLLEILPNELYGDYNRIIESTNEFHHVYYHNGVDEEFLMSVYSEELIDSLYKMIVLCIKNGHLKF